MEVDIGCFHGSVVRGHLDILQLAYSYSWEYKICCRGAGAVTSTFFTERGPATVSDTNDVPVCWQRGASRYSPVGTAQRLSLERVHVLGCGRRGESRRYSMDTV